jgi:cation transport regulator ChaC
VPNGQDPCCRTADIAPYGRDADGQAQPVDWVFAYGSLLPAGHAALPEGAVAVDLHGWQRSWSVAMDNSVDLPNYKHYVAPDGGRPALMVCYLNIEERPGAVVNGVALRVGADELPALDARERNYDRRDVTGQFNVTLGGRVWAYVGRRSGRARARRGRRERRLAIASSYHERVLAGFDLLRQRRRFELLTQPAGVPVADLSLVRHAPAVVPRSVR